MVAAQPLVVGSGGIPHRLPIPPAPALPLATRPPSVPPPTGRDGRRTRLWLTVAVVCGSAIYLVASASWAAAAKGGWTLVGGRRGARGAPSASSSPAAVGVPQELPVGGDAVAADTTRLQELRGGGTRVSDGYALPAGTSAVPVDTLGATGATGGQGGPAAGTSTLVVASRAAEGFRTDSAAVAAAPNTVATASAVAAPHADNTAATATGGAMEGTAPGAGSAAATVSRRSLHGGDGRGGSDGPVPPSGREAASAAVDRLLAAATAADGAHLVGATLASSMVGGDHDEPASVPGTAHLVAPGAAADVAYTGGAPASTAAGGGGNDVGSGDSALAAATTVGSRSATETALPPTSSMASVIGAVYVLNALPCTDKLAWVRERARAAVGLDVPLTILPAVAGQEVSLDAPPLPVARTALPADATVSGGQLAATASHRAAWRRAVAEGHPVVVVLEDDTFPTDELLTRLPALVRGLDMGAAAEETSWHVAYLSRHPLGAVAAEKTWSVAGAEGDASASVAAAVAGVPLLPPRRLTVAGRSWGGTAAYLLTATGARHLLAAVTTYRGPLDEVLSDVPGLVVLSACNNDAPVHRCPENVVRAGAADVGGCAQPAAAVGERRPGTAFGEPRGGERTNRTATAAEMVIAAAAAAAADAQGGAVATEGVADAVRPAEGDADAAREVMAVTAGTPGGVAVLERAVAPGDAVSPAGTISATARTVTTTAAPGAPAGPATAGAPDGAAATEGEVPLSAGTAGLAARGDAAVTVEAAATAVGAPDDDAAAILDGIAEGEAAALWGTALGDVTAPSGASLAA